MGLGDVTLLLTLLINVSGIVWGAAKLSAKVGALTDTIARVERDLTKELEGARKDFRESTAEVRQTQKEINENFRQTLREIEGNIRRVDRKVAVLMNVMKLRNGPSENDL